MRLKQPNATLLTAREYFKGVVDVANGCEVISLERTQYVALATLIVKIDNRDICIELSNPNNVSLNRLMELTKLHFSNHAQSSQTLSVIHDQILISTLYTTDTPYSIIQTPHKITVIKDLQLDTKFCKLTNGVWTKTTFK